MRARPLIGAADDIRYLPCGELHGLDKIDQFGDVLEESRLLGGFPQAQKVPSRDHGVVGDLAPGPVKIVDGFAPRVVLEPYTVHDEFVGADCTVDKFAARLARVGGQQRAPSPNPFERRNQVLALG